MGNDTVFLNASEHLFNLGLSETLMLRNYSRVNNFKFCSMVGGSESIRDIYEASNLASDAFEFMLVESIFSMRKIFLAIEKVFLNRIEILEDIKIFINISTPDSIRMIKQLDKITLPRFLRKSNIVFNFDRRSLARTYHECKNYNFDYSEYEDTINPIIYEKIVCLNSLNYKTSISGGMDKNSIDKFLTYDILPSYIKTGLFSLPLNEANKNDLFENVRGFQVIEAKLLNLMKDSLYNRYDYLNQRQMHLVNYLVESIN